MFMHMSLPVYVCVCIRLYTHTHTFYPSVFSRAVLDVCVGVCLSVCVWSGHLSLFHWLLNKAGNE